MRYILSKSYSIIGINIFTAVFVTLTLSNLIIAYDMVGTPADTLGDYYMSFSINENSMGLNSIIETVKESGSDVLLLRYNKSNSCGVLASNIMFTPDILEGRSFVEEDFNSHSNVVIIDESYVKKCQEMNGKKYYIMDNDYYEVIGIFRRTENSINQDAYIYYNLLSDHVLNKENNDIGQYAIDAGKNTQSIVNQINELANIEIMHTIDNNSFWEKLQQAVISQQINLFPLIMIIIVIILNSVNTSFNWVENRKNEIIVRKICGATKKKINQMIVRDYIYVSIFSYSFGYVLAYIISHIDMKIFVGFSFSLLTVIVSFAATVIIGLCVALIMMFSYEQKTIAIQRKE